MHRTKKKLSNFETSEEKVTSGHEVRKKAQTIFFSKNQMPSDFKENNSTLFKIVPLFKSTSIKKHVE